MRQFSKSTLVTLAAAIVLPLSAHAGVSSVYGHHDYGHKLKVALWGDNFYAADPVLKAAMKDQTINSMNSHRLDFTIFAGDTKNGSSECTDQAIGADVIDIFNRIHAPTMYTLGDNEWTDCHRANNGSMDPLDRLAYLRATFFNKVTTQGARPIPVERQGALGDAYSENSRFEMNHVEFVALHIPGSNNNLVASSSQCTKKTGRDSRQWDDVNHIPLGECADAAAEYQARNTQNVAWLHDSFDKARANGAAGIVITIQADVFFPFELSDGGYVENFLPSLDEKDAVTGDYVNGYRDFFHALADETNNFAGQVLLVHGDSHALKIDKPMTDADGNMIANFTRIEVFGSTENSWVEMTVDPTSKEVFTFEPVVLSRP